MRAVKCGVVNFVVALKMFFLYFFLFLFIYFLILILSFKYWQCDWSERGQIGDWQEIWDKQAIVFDTISPHIYVFVYDRTHADTRKHL